MRKIIGELIYVLIFATGGAYCIFQDSPWAYLGILFFGGTTGMCIRDLVIAIKEYKITKCLMEIDPDDYPEGTDITQF